MVNWPTYVRCDCLDRSYASDISFKLPAVLSALYYQYRYIAVNSPVFDSKTYIDGQKKNECIQMCAAFWLAPIKIG